jgi:hypothetical protein
MEGPVLGFFSCIRIAPWLEGLTRPSKKPLANQARRSPLSHLWEEECRDMVKQLISVTTTLLAAQGELCIAGLS